MAARVRVAAPAPKDASLPCWLSPPALGNAGVTGGVSPAHARRPRLGGAGTWPGSESALRSAGCPWAVSGAAERWVLSRWVGCAPPLSTRARGWGRRCRKSQPGASLPPQSRVSCTFGVCSAFGERSQLESDEMFLSRGERSCASLPPAAAWDRPLQAAVTDVAALRAEGRGWGGLVRSENPTRFNSPTRV